MDAGVPSHYLIAYVYSTRSGGNANGTPASCLRTLLQAGLLLSYNDELRIDYPQ